MKMANTKINHRQTEDVAPDVSAVLKTEQKKRLKIKLNPPSPVSSNLKHKMIRFRLFPVTLLSF